MRVKKISMLVILSSSFVFLIVATAGLIGYISLRNGTQAVNDLARQLQAQVVIHIQETLGEYLAMPHRLNRLNAEMIAQNPALLEDLESLRPVYVCQIEAFDSVTTVAVGLEQQGNFIGIGRKEEGVFTIALMNRSQDSTYRLSLFDREGNALGLVTETPDYDARTRAWYQTAVQAGKAAWSPIYVWASGASIGITAVLPIYDPAGPLIGVHQSALTLDFISTFLQGLRIGKAGQVFLIEQDGMLVASSTPEHVLRKNAENFERFRAAESGIPFIRETSSHLSTQFGSLDHLPDHYHTNLMIDGQQHFISVAQLHDPHGLNWTLIVGLPEADVMEQIDANTHTTIVLCVIASLAATWLGVIIARRLTAANQRLEREIAERIQSEARYRRLFEDAPIALWEEDFSATKTYLEQLRTQGITDFERYFDEHPSEIAQCMSMMRVLDVNQAVLQLYGAQDKQELFARLFETFDPNSKTATIAALASLAAGNPVFEIETAALKLTGAPMSLLLRSFVNSEEQDAFARIIVAMVDLSERKQAEAALRESERKFRFLTERTNDLIYLYRLQPQRGFEYVSPSAERITGYTPEEHYNDPQLGMKLVHPEDAPRLQAFLNGDVDRAPIALRWRKKDGSTIWTELENIPVYNDLGELIAIQGKASDITERKRAEKALRESEARFRSIFEYSGAGIALSDLQGKILQVNSTFCAMLGYAEEELVGQMIQSISHPGDMAEETREILRVIAGESPVYQREKRYLRKDGQTMWGLLTISVIRDIAGAPISVVGQVQDVTKRKRVEEALRESEARYADLYENAPEMYLSVDAGTACILKCNQTLTRMLGYKKTELIGRPIFALYHPDCLDEVQAAFQQFVTTGEVSDKELKVRRKDGSSIDVSLNVTAIRDATGKILHSRSSWRDITDRKRTEKSLQESETLLNAVGEIARIGGWDLNAETLTVRWTRETYRIHEVLERDSVSLDEALNFYHPEDRPILVEALQRALTQGDAFDLELRFLTATGTPLWVRAIGRPIVEGGKITRLIGVFQDISHRKQAEEALRESEERFRLAFENANIGMCLVDMAGRFVKVNQQMRAIFGYRPEEFEHMTVNDITHPAYRDVSPNFIERARTGEIEQNEFEKMYLHHDGHPVWGLVRSALLRDRHGAPLYFVSHVQDITERKRTEEALAKSNRLLEAVIKQAPFAAHVLEGDFNHIHVILENDESTRIMGERLEGRRDIDASRPETLATRFFSVDGAREIPVAQMPSPRAFQGEVVRNEEFLFRHPDGTEILVEANASPVYDHAGRIIAIVVTFHDITDRKRIENALRESEEKYRMLIEYSNDVIWTMDLTGKFTYVSPSVFRLRGFTPEEVMQQPIEEVVCSTSLPTVQKGFRIAFEVISSGQDDRPPEYFEIEQPRRDGTTVWTEATARLMYNSEGQPIGLVGVSRDISERKRMEADIRRAKEQAEIAEHLKSTFFANVSHHLRTPLNVILGFADLMVEDATLPTTYQEYLALIQQSGKDLLALINQMLKVAKLNPEEIMTDKSSRQLFDLLESQTPQATLTPQVGIHLGEEEFEALRCRVQELPQDLRRRFIEATQRLDIALMSQIIEQVRQAQPAAADALKRLARNFEYERILVLLREERSQ